MTETAPPAMPAADAPRPAPPSEFPPPVKKTVEWLNDMFAEWYRRNPPPMPDRFTRREFGYILWPDRPGTPPFIRHKAYDNSDRFHWYLQKAGPHSVYYSTAYYRRPGEMKMLDKQWLGAELIFDLDADHLVEAEKAKAEGHEMTLAAQLALVKTQFKRLLDEFLFGDFGLGEDDVWITFSGGRGYHAHVVQEKLLALGSRERREVVDYVTGKIPAVPGSTTPDISVFMERKVLRAREWQGKVKTEEAFRLAAVEAPGWPGRLSRTLFQVLDENVFAVERKVARRWLLDLEGIGTTSADKFLARIDNFANNPDRLKTVPQLLAEGNISHRNDPLFKIAEKALETWGIALAKGETDEPVTADTKRLIRLPGSLHGKSGLKVVTLRRDDLDGFEPLRDAVAFPPEPTRIVPRNDATMALGGETVSIRKGEPQDVPLPHAVFWLARQGGTIVVR
ncbi:MAG TPA: DNA primase catalytic subunit PriS [Candidatus Thermoplasmatota archaeon]|nr:DNA primase catalytic subunit PriS [Candidatus Thermoplasmatota archaeon]